MNKGIRFTDEFKHDAVAQVVERGYAVSEVAERLGCPSSDTCDPMEARPQNRGLPNYACFWAGVHAWHTIPILSFIALHHQQTKDEGMETKSEPTPLQWGDRIEHKKFGLGTVESEPEGEKVHVIWDVPNRTPDRVVSSFLRLVTRTDAKGGAFWNHEYSKLLKTVENTRAATNRELARAFRPIDGDGLSKLEQALESEAKALNDLRDFLAVDEKGEHP